MCTSWRPCIQTILQQLPIFSDIAGSGYEAHFYCLNELVGAVDKSLSQTDMHTQVVAPQHQLRVALETTVVRVYSPAGISIWFERNLRVSRRTPAAKATKMFQCSASMTQFIVS